MTLVALDPSFTDEDAWDYAEATGLYDTTEPQMRPARVWGNESYPCLMYKVPGEPYHLDTSHLWAMLQEKELLHSKPPIRVPAVKVPWSAHHTLELFGPTGDPTTDAALHIARMAE